MIQQILEIFIWSTQSNCIERHEHAMLKPPHTARAISADRFEVTWLGLRGLIAHSSLTDGRAQLARKALML